MIHRFGDIVFHSKEIGICKTDVDLNILDANQRFKDIFLLPKNCDDMEGLEQNIVSDERENTQLIAKIMHKKQIHSFSIELSGLRTDGVLIPILFEFLRTDDDQFLILVIDNTQYSLAEKKIAELRASLRQNIMTNSTFAELLFFSIDRFLTFVQKHKLVERHKVREFENEIDDLRHVIFKNTRKNNLTDIINEITLSNRLSQITGKKVVISNTSGYRLISDFDFLTLALSKILKTKSDEAINLNIKNLHDETIMIISDLSLDDFYSEDGIIKYSNIVSETDTNQSDCDILFASALLCTIDVDARIVSNTLTLVFPKSS